jgi:hypothetical protein
MSKSQNVQKILVFDENNLKRQTVPEVKILYRLTYTPLKNLKFPLDII